jgi:TetR/AcrR family transcriptional repressor of lmrAB and yxaGH operons
MMSDMPRRSDSKDRMITAARQLFREHGYLGTALSDVITDSAAPRGSLYFHFPGGKEELATEVILVYAADLIAHTNRAAATTHTAVELIQAFMARYRDELVDSNYRAGCALAYIVLEATPASPQLSDVTRRGFQDLITTLAARLEEKNIPPDQAHQLATLAVTTMEGALLLSRALRNTTPFDTATTQLVATAQAATTK